MRLALIAVLLLTLPAAGQAWTQVGGGMGGEPIVPYEGTLDIKDRFSLFPQNAFAHPYGQGILWTPHGLVGIARESLAVPQCALYRHGVEIEVFPLGDCTDPPRIQAYDEERDQLIVCETANAADAPVLSGFDGTTLERTWSLTADELVRLYRGEPVSCLARLDPIARALFLVVFEPSAYDPAETGLGYQQGSTRSMTLHRFALDSFHEVWMVPLGVGNTPHEKVNDALPRALVVTGQTLFLDVLRSTGESDLHVFLRDGTPVSTTLGSGEQVTFDGTDSQASPHWFSFASPISDEDRAVALVGASVIVFHAGTGARETTFRLPQFLGIVHASLARTPDAVVVALGTQLHDFRADGTQRSWTSPGGSIEDLRIQGRVAWLLIDGNQGLQIWPFDLDTMTPRGAWFAMDDDRITWFDATLVRSEGAPGYGFATSPTGLYAWTNSGSIVELAPTTAAPRVSISDRHPDVGEEVTVTVEAPPSSEVHLWLGEGPFVSVAPGSPYNHRFATEGLKEIQASVIHSDGTTATALREVRVGTVASGPTLLQTAFAPENQELTYFMLGVSITVIGAIYAVWRLRRRRTRLKRELIALDSVFTSARGSHQQRAALDERRAHVRGLLFDGKIDESQARVLESRIDAIGRDAAVSSLAAQFDFLPHGFVQRLERMLADGRLSGWEETTLRELLSHDRNLSRAQKEKVLKALSDWGT